MSGDLASTQGVESAYIGFMMNTMSPRDAEARFRRWHAEELRKARAEGWEEGYTMGTEGVFDADNPYRADQNEVNNNG